LGKYRFYQRPWWYLLIKVYSFIYSLRKDKTVPNSTIFSKQHLHDNEQDCVNLTGQLLRTCIKLFASQKTDMILMSTTSTPGVECLQRTM